MEIKLLKNKISQCMRKDQYRLTKRLQRLQMNWQRVKLNNSEITQLADEIEKSIQQKEQRLADLPAVTFPEDLPVTQYVHVISEALEKYQVIVVAGETGSGKTTQLPKICLACGRGIDGIIGHTQPRRVAARSVASRIAIELRSQVGAAVGYKIRFSDQVHEASYIKVMTDGILLTEIQSDRYLEQYDTLIIDEAHERSLNIDFILGYLKQLLPKRPDLKIIITSATIDPQRFAKFFNEVPIIEVSGRGYPVAIKYQPLQSIDDDARDQDQIQAILNSIDEILLEGPGDILVFLSGEREIREVSYALHKQRMHDVEILPLYARLNAAEQNKVFEAHTKRRIILATNVAETSLTVPGMVYVIDTGMARISRYSYRTKVQRLPIEKISQASAKQRAGRCGRTSPGVCIRLYSEEDFLMRPEFTEPEIMRTNLAAVILQMAALRLGDVENFPFVEPPDSRYIRDGYRLLQELNALDEKKTLTYAGKQLAKFPLDPRFGKMLLTAKHEACVTEILIIVSALSIQDPRERPLEFQQAADQKHQQYADDRSDFMALLKLWQDFTQQQQHLSQSKLRQYCRENFLSYVRLREWQEIHGQLLALCNELGLRPNQDEAGYAAIHRAILSGLLSHIACKSDHKEYQGARNIKLQIFPGSTVFKKQPKWIVAAEFVETSRLFARTVGTIEPEWIERLADQLLKRTYSEPHWEKRIGQVAAYEKISLYGLVINPRKKINYGPIDPELAREIFIREALVAGDYTLHADFFKHNEKLIADIANLENKARRRDILIDEHALFEFYADRIPQGIYNVTLFEKWRKAAEMKEPKLLFLTREFLLRQDEAVISEELFPNYLLIGDVKLPLTYHFEPGHSKDGVTATIPLGILNQLPENCFTWLVPGLLRDKVIALLKILPKSLRKNFVPIPEYADRCLEALVPSTLSLVDALTTCLHEQTGILIPTSAWQGHLLDANLLMNFEIINEHGKLIGTGRNLEQLRQQLKANFDKNLHHLQQEQFARDNITTWDFGDIPEQVEFKQGTILVQAFPALNDKGDSVAIKLFDNKIQAQAAMQQGLRRMFFIAEAKQIKYLSKQLHNLSQISLLYSVIGSKEELLNEMSLAVIQYLYINDQPLIYREKDFYQRLEQKSASVIPFAADMAPIILACLTEYHNVLKLLKATRISCVEIKQDIEQQLSHLISKGFILQTPLKWLQRIPYYLKALAVRLTKLATNWDKDREYTKELANLWQAYRRHIMQQQHQGTLISGEEEYRWLLEEYRISLFAQQLKTIVPISRKRLDQYWTALQKD